MSGLGVVYDRIFPLRWTLVEKAQNPVALQPLLAKTKQKGDCLIWRGRKVSSTTAAFAAFEAYHGRKLTNRIIRICDTPKCVSPKHNYDAGKRFPLPSTTTE